MEPDTKEILRIRVEKVQRRYQNHSVIFRVLWIVAGLTVVAAGLAMTLLPGPALVVLPIGLAMLAAEFAWARRLLNLGIDRGVDVKRRVESAPPAAKLLGGLTSLFLVGAVLAYLVLS